MATSQLSPLIAGADLAEKVPLDSGTFGNDVYLCHHKTHGQLLIKTVCTGRHLSESKKRSLLKEAEPLLRLNHSRVVRVLGVVLEDGPSSLVMQIFPKGHLLAILEEVPVPISVKGRIILDILEGMVYLTTSGIVHKDLKPQNILVDEDFHIKIADLGLASCRSWSKLTMEESHRHSRKGASSKSGTLFYMAPEHLQSLNTPFTEKSDVYSFAIITWVTLTNMEPYSNEDDQVTSAVCSGSRPDVSRVPPHTPREMLTLMQECWHQDPPRRPPFSESHNSFQYFYRDELEQNAERDLKSLTGRTASPDLTAEMSALSLSEPLWQTDAGSGSVGLSAETSVEGPQARDGLWFGSLQTDALPARRDHAPHGSFVSSPDLSVPPCPGRQRPVQSGDASPPRANVPLRGRRSERLSKAEACKNCTPQPGNPRIRSWPVIPEWEGYGSCAGADSASALHRQCSAGVFIQHAVGVQIGDNNHMTIGNEDYGEDFEPSPADLLPYDELLQKYEDRPVRKEQLELLSKSIGQNWKCCARRLGLSNVEVETISYNYNGEGLREMVHQMLEKWQTKTGAVGCTVGGLCRALRDNVGMDVLCQLLRMCQGGATP
ncbi:receptor-interacting serine/threonine-protein kinase 1-like [Conger conger]|uniref:receptor-interacting serine/threonine-protein kinase 1-like n=1 Tax=Conger conger TaxID=82655 RepID=UPI002A5A4FA1|nr:receptor-interacting serine/threonine-protein kinase 1-like [Conger conger]